MAPVPYRITVHNIEACNCDTACGCQFSGFPTSNDGGCEALIGGEVKEGKYGDIVLDGVRYVLAIDYPKAIHQGNGNVAVFIDDKASDKQAEAMAMILWVRLEGCRSRHWRRRLRCWKDRCASRSR